VSEPVRLGDMERAPEFPMCMMGTGARLALRAQAAADGRDEGLLPW